MALLSFSMGRESDDGERVGFQTIPQPDYLSSLGEKHKGEGEEGHSDPRTRAGTWAAKEVRACLFLFPG